MALSVKSAEPTMMSPPAAGAPDPEAAVPPVAAGVDVLRGSLLDPQAVSARAATANAATREWRFFMRFSLERGRSAGRGGGAGGSGDRDNIDNIGTPPARS